MKIIPPCEAELKDSGLIGRTVLCDGLNAFPGLIDQHIHITGGGGEHGFSEHVTEIHIYDIINAGVSTVAGLLGADGVTRSLEALFAKAKTLEELGLSTYIYSGSYAMPPVSFTGSVLRDIILIDKVIGAGEIAISDHRSSQPDLPDMMKLASEVHLGGMISGKAGVLHIHVGDGKKGLEPLVKILDESDLPIGMFVPTHLNRNPELFRQATEYCRSGGNIDLTAGEKAGLPVYRCIEMLISEGMDLSRVTVSSDANGSIPEGGVSKIIWLYEDIVSCIRKAKLSPGAAFSLATENVAKVLKLYPRKGCLKEGGDADILVTDKDYNIKMLFCRGRLMKKLSEKL